MTAVSLFSSSPQKDNIQVTKELSQEESIALLLVDIIVSNSKIAIIEWVKKNNRIKSVYLQRFFINFMQKFMKKLDEEITIPTF